MLAIFNSKPSPMEKIITKTTIKQQTSDFHYWQQQTPHPIKLTNFSD